MRVLITRPEREATALAAALGERGHTVVIAPLFHLQVLHPPTGFEATLAACQAVLLTSANGARALAEATHQRGRRVLAVGDTTATTAEGLGFSAVTSAAGDGAALAELVRQRLDPKAGPLLHVCGTEVGFDLVETLGGNGFEVHRVALYEARQADRLPASATAALQARALDIATFFSPRASALFGELVTGANLGDALRPVTAVAISPAALAPLAALPFKAAIAAERPTRQAVLDEVDRLATEGIQGSVQASGREQAPVTDNPMSDSTPSSSPVEARTAEPAQIVIRRGLGFFGALLGGVAGALLFLVAIVATLPLWPHFLMSLWRGGDAPAIDVGQIRADAGTAARSAIEVVRHDLGQRLEELEKRLKALADNGGNKAAVADPAIAELRGRIAALENRPASSAPPAAPAPPVASPSPSPETEKEVADLQRQIEALRATLQTLDQRVASQREQAKSLSDTLSARGTSEQKVLQAARAAATIGVAARISFALDLGAPFSADLALLGPLIQGDAKLGEIVAQLQPYAEAGVVSRAALAADFPAVAKAALAQDLADDSFGERVLGKLRNLVSLRRVGDVPGDSVDAKIARAEVALKQGNLTQAVALMKSLPANVASAVAPWLAKAEAHLATEQAVDRLSAYAVQLLGQSR
ncbi:MAG: uroporphyrinogen-III synthase [Alphaproteobacteria bacterium]|nr:uroporphyrinogen-III synthase [Alphaproteobacteria bacterium]